MEAGKPREREAREQCGPAHMGQQPGKQETREGWGEDREGGPPGTHPREGRKRPQDSETGAASRKSQEAKVPHRRPAQLPRGTL